MKKRNDLIRLLLPILLLLTLAVLFAGCKENEEGTETGTETGTVSEEPTTPANETAADTETETDGVPTAGPDDIICKNPDFEFTYTEEKYEAINKKTDELYAYLEAANPEDQEAFLKLYEEVEDQDFNELMGQYMVVNIQNSMYTTYEDVQARMEDMSKKYNDMLQRLITMYDDIDESPFGEEFYKDWTQEEHDLAVRMAKNYTDELSALRVEYDKLESEYQALPADGYFLGKTSEMYVKAVDLNKQIAKISGYDNFMDYAYEMSYERDYSPEDVEQMRGYVIKYLVPILRPLLSRVQKLNDKVSNDGKDYMNYVAYSEATLAKLGVVPEMGTASISASGAVNEYLNTMGEDMMAKWQEMWEKNRYIVAFNGDVSRNGAFSAYLYHVNYPMMYFGPGYQDMFTVIHEFGHSYAMTLSGSSDIPMDLAEVQSQGNEWLFLAFLKNKMTANAYEFMADYRLFSDLVNIVNCIAVNDFEAYVYSHDITDPEEYDKVMEQVLKDLGVYDLFIQIYANPVSYWHYVAIDNAGYYISYAMSLVPSITLYAEAMNDFDKAAASYLSLATVGEYDTFLGKLEAAGISSPFDEKTYQDIVAVYKK